MAKKQLLVNAKNHDVIVEILELLAGSGHTVELSDDLGRFWPHSSRVKAAEALRMITTGQPLRGCHILRYEELALRMEQEGRFRGEQVVHNSLRLKKRIRSLFSGRR